MPIAIAGGARRAALDQFSRQTGCAVLMDPALLRQGRSPALNGRYAPVAALQRLLDDPRLDIAETVNGLAVMPTAPLDPAG